MTPRGQHRLSKQQKDQIRNQPHKLPLSPAVQAAWELALDDLMFDFMFSTEQTIGDALQRIWASGFNTAITMQINGMLD